MNRYFNLSILFLSIISVISCEDGTSDINVPPTYTFERDGQSTVNFTGQSIRIQMAEELTSAMISPQISYFNLLDMFENLGRTGEDVSPFSTELLNTSSKSISSKIAASIDYFSSNTVESAKIKSDFTSWMEKQVSEINIFSNDIASSGHGGQIADGTNIRYVNEKGLEFDQVVTKSLIGSLMLDQMLNNYLSVSILDEGDNRSNNDAGITEEERSYTTMEHKWDEAYGYLIGNSATPESPLQTLGSDDNFLNKYTGKVSEDPDFESIGTEIIEGFIKGRAAITQHEYEVRDEMILGLKENLSKVLGIRTVYCLQQGKNKVISQDMGAAFHALSEAYGFLYSLRFTNKGFSSESYFSRAEVDTLLSDLLDDGEHGFWDVTPQTLDNISNSIASKFDFSVEAAAE